MSPDTRPKATIFIVFGFAGDLTWPKLVPALYNLFLENRRPEHFAILGLGHRHLSAEDFPEHLQQGVEQFAKGAKAKKESWGKFSEVV